MNKPALKVSGGLMVILLTLVLFGGVVVLTFFLFDQIGQLSQAESDLAVAINRRQSLDQLQKLIIADPVDRSSLDSYFVTNDNLPIFIEKLEGLASSTPVKFNLTGAAVNGEGGASSVRLTFVAEASFPKLFQFISRVDALPYALTIVEARLSNQTAGGSDILKRVWSGEFAVDVLRVPTSKDLNEKAKPKK